MKQHWLTALLITALIPYGIVCFYALPFGDDFCFGWTAAENISFLQKFLNQYMYWNGRYTGDMLINLHPILTGKLWVLQTVLLASLLFTPVAWYVLCKQLVGEKGVALIAALFITLFYLCYMPQLTEGVYWYGGIVNYHLGNVVLLLHVALECTNYTYCALRRPPILGGLPYEGGSPPNVGGDVRRTEEVYRTLSIALLILVIGFNEVAAVFVPLVYLLLTFYTLRIKHPMHKRFFWLLALSVIAAAFVILAPGNMVRMEVANGGHQFFYSAFYALLQTGRFIATWIFNYPALALFLLLALYADDWKQRLYLQIDWRITTGLAVVLLFLSAFIPYYATGMLGQHRTINYAFFFVMPLLAYSVLQAAAAYGWVQKLNILSVRLRFSKPASKNFILISAVMVLVFTGNGLLIVKDFAQGKFTTYNEQFMQRQHDVKKGVTPYPLKTVPSVFTITDAADSTHWVSMCIENYYRVGEVK